MSSDGSEELPDSQLFLKIVATLHYLDRLDLLRHFRIKLINHSSSIDYF